MSKKFLKALIYSLFLLYMIVLIKLILFRIPMDQIMLHISRSWSDFGRRISYIQIVPFRTISEYVVNSNNLPLRIIIENLLGNIIAFMPLGFFLPLISRKVASLSRVTIWTLSISFSLETIQLLLGLGSCDIDDLLLNILGGILGFLALRGLKFIVGNLNILRAKKLFQ